MRRTVGVMAMAAVLTGVMGTHAGAHVAIVLVIVSPSEGERVGPDPAVVVSAERTAGGVDGTAFRLEVDGRVVPAYTGVTIRVGQQVRLPLRDLSPGRHVATVRYRPDTDQPETTNEVVFLVGEPGGSGVPVALVMAVATVALMGGLLVWRRVTSRR